MQQSGKGFSSSQSRVAALGAESCVLVERDARQMRSL